MNKEDQVGNIDDRETAGNIGIERICEYSEEKRLALGQIES